MPFVPRSILFLQASLAGIWTTTGAIMRVPSYGTASGPRQPTHCAVARSPDRATQRTEGLPKTHHADIPEPPPKSCNELACRNTGRYHFALSIETHLAI